MVPAVQVPVDRQLARVVGPLREPERVAAGRVAILPATVELVLLLVVAMDEVTSASAGQPVRIAHAVGGARALGARAGPCRRRDIRVEELETLRAKERIPGVRQHNTLYDGRYRVPT